MSGGGRPGRNPVRLAWAAGLAHPESPRWLARERELVFVDVASGTLLRHAPGREARAGRRERLAAELGFAVPRADGALLYGHGTTVARLGADAPLAVLPGDVAQLRLNDAGVDAQGALWTGTMDRRGERALGALYRIAPDGTVATIADGFTIPNGFAASRIGDTLYVADSPLRVVYAFELDGAGLPRARRSFLGAESFGRAYPDGMAVDAEDHLWVACYDGGCLRRFRPDGTLEREVALPVARVTACAFGGDALDLLFVTAGEGLYVFEPGVAGAASAGRASPVVASPGS